MEQQPVVDDMQTEIPEVVDSPSGDGIESTLSTDMDTCPVIDSQEDDAPEAEKKTSPPKKKRVSKYTAISKASFTSGLERRDDVFVAPLDYPLYIISPTVTLHSDLYDDEELNEYVTLKLKRSHVSVFEDLETRLLESAKNNKDLWFHNPEMTDEFLEKSLKKFVNTDDRTVMVRVDEGLGGKTGAGRGTKVKVVLHADAAIFTRTQYGILWTMQMIKSIEKHEDQYLFDPEEDPNVEGIMEGDLLSKLAGDSGIDTEF